MTCGVSVFFRTLRPRARGASGAYHERMSDFQKRILRNYAEHHDTIQSNKLSELVSELWLAEGAAAEKLWGKAQIALMRMNVPGQKAASIVNKRDVEALAGLVKELDEKGKLAAPPEGEKKPEETIARSARSLADGRTIKQMQSQLAAESGHDSLDEPNLKRALKAFRRKLKSMRLDDESRLGNKYTTAGRSSGITAITPPNDYPPPVWEKLAELGRLKKAGSGMYELPG